MQRPPTSDWRRVATPLALAAISLLAALALWVAVTDAENPQVTRDFAGVIPVQAINVPQGQAVFRISESGVQIRVRTDEDRFEELTTSDFVAEVDLAGERETSFSRRVIVRYVGGGDDVQIAAVTPSVVDIVLEPEATKQVPVQLNRNGSPPQGFSVSSIEANPTTARVRGAQSLVALAESAAADVNLTGVRINLQQRYPLIPRDASGANLRLRVEPEAVEVRIGITQQEFSWPVTITPRPQGSVADGYALVAITPEPPVIAVTGPVEAVQAVSTLLTDPIDVSGLDRTLTRSVKLQLPTGLKASRDTVNVTLKVEPLQGEFVFPVAPQVENLANGLRASLQTTSVSVRVRGAVPTILALPTGSIRATVDASGLGEGVHVLPVSVSVPQGVTLVAYDPQQVVVLLRP
ncbi:MAG TPA: CdaR family protein [Dehalococcoidia bacterium]|nr:CdaR family protein [Dehalococcoidia bacterium]